MSLLGVKYESDEEESDLKSTSSKGERDPSQDEVVSLQTSPVDESTAAEIAEAHSIEPTSALISENGTSREGGAGKIPQLEEDIASPVEISPQRSEGPGENSQSVQEELVDIIDPRFHDLMPRLEKRELEEESTARVREKVSSFLTQMRKRRCTYTETVKRNHEFGNPAVLSTICGHFNVDDKRSNYPPELFNPYGYQMVDYKDVIAAEGRKYQRLVEQEKAAAAQAAAPPDGAAKHALLSGFKPPQPPPPFLAGLKPGLDGSRGGGNTRASKWGGVPARPATQPPPTLPSFLNKGVTPAAAIDSVARAHAQAAAAAIASRLSAGQTYGNR